MAKGSAAPIVEIVKRSDHASGFIVLPMRWVVERTLAWLNRCRRLAKPQCLGLPPTCVNPTDAAKALQSSINFSDRRALRNNPVPLTCWECGKALVGGRIVFCSIDCAKAFPADQLYGRAEGHSYGWT
jgi:hypothetical protein